MVVIKMLTTMLFLYTYYFGLDLLIFDKWAFVNKSKVMKKHLNDFLPGKQ